VRVYVCVCVCMCVCVCACVCVCMYVCVCMCTCVCVFELKDHEVLDAGVSALAQDALCSPEKEHAHARVGRRVEGKEGEEMVNGECGCLGGGQGSERKQIRGRERARGPGKAKDSLRVSAKDRKYRDVRKKGRETEHRNRGTCVDEWSPFAKRRLVRAAAILYLLCHPVFTTTIQ